MYFSIIDSSKTMETRFPLTNDYLKKTFGMLYMHSRILFGYEKMTFAIFSEMGGTRGIMQGEMNQKEKDKYWVIASVCDTRK